MVYSFNCRLKRKAKKDCYLVAMRKFSNYNDSESDAGNWQGLLS